MISRTFTQAFMNFKTWNLFESLQTKITFTEAGGTFVLKKKPQEFPRISWVAYEPEGTACISSQVFTSETYDYWIQFNSKCQPLSIIKHPSTEKIQLAITEV